MQCRNVVNRQTGKFVGLFVPNSSNLTNLWILKQHELEYHRTCSGGANSQLLSGNLLQFASENGP